MQLCHVSLSQQCALPNQSPIQISVASSRRKENVDRTGRARWCDQLPARGLSSTFYKDESKVAGVASNDRLTTIASKATLQGGVYSRAASMSGMRRVISPVQATADVAVLQMHAEHAGVAWGCPFSSSDEFEAAVIRAKRRSGAYARKRLLRPASAVAIAVAVSAAALCFLL
jgi:hypothetical protein